MKRALILMLLLLPILSFGQNMVSDTNSAYLSALPFVFPREIPTKCADLKIRDILDNRFWLSSGTMFFAGIADAHMQVLHNSYGTFRKMFPQANQNFWDWEKSSNNKYKENDPSKGPKFWGSTTYFVFLTDGYHLMQLFRNTGITASIAINLVPPKKSYEIYGGRMIKTRAYYYNGKWYVIIGKAIAEFLCFNVGKELTFRIYDLKK